MSGQSSGIRQDHLDHLVAMALAIETPQAFCAPKRVIGFLRECRAVRIPDVFNADMKGVFCCAQQTGVHRIACGGTASYLFYLGSELTLIGIRKPYQSSTCLVRYSWPLPSWISSTGSCPLSLCTTIEIKLPLRTRLAR
jgi:hypothetical protein